MFLFFVNSVQTYFGVCPFSFSLLFKTLGFFNLMFYYKAVSVSNCYPAIGFNREILPFFLLFQLHISVHNAAFMALSMIAFSGQ
jgi:hypothetical protein